MGAFIVYFVLWFALGVIVVSAVQSARTLNRIADAHEGQSATLKLVFAAVIDPSLVRVTHPPTQVPDYQPEDL